MPNVRPHALVVCYRRDDLAGRFLMRPPADIRAGRCIGCGVEVYVNPSGAQAIRERDCDLVCTGCGAVGVRRHRNQTDQRD